MKVNFNVLSLPVKPKTPSVTASPSDAKVAVNTKITLTCKTSSSGATSYKWLLNNHLISHSPTTNTYTVPTSKTGSGTYSCVATVSGVDSSPSAGKVITVIG